MRHKATGEPCDEMWPLEVRVPGIKGQGTRGAAARAKNNTNASLRVAKDFSFSDRSVESGHVDST